MSQNKLLPSVFNDMVTPPNSAQRRKSKPMIVDISINDQGEQIYQVQNNNRKRKYQQFEADDEQDNEVTPIRSVLGTVSPNTLNQAKRINTGEHKERFNDEYNGSPNTRRATSSASSSSTTATKISTTTTSSSSTSEPTNDVNIWSEDVEEAFEEALKIIPKNGLTKIKISGKSCGRNELISDYIYQQTGKSRTRKQVSSHIQVIKNLKKNKELIELINNGPSDPEAIIKFDEIFSEISFQKSIGGSSNVSSSSNYDNGLSTPKTKPSSSRKKISPPSVTSRRTSSRQKKTPSKPIGFTMKKFEMSYLDFEEPFNSHTFTKLSSLKLDTALRLKPDANISNRFPNLKDYHLNNVEPELQIPILHNMVNLNLPPWDKKIDGKHETKLQVELKNVPSDESEFGCLTVIYSFGNEVIRLIDDVPNYKQQKNLVNPLEFKNHILELPFAKEFWNAFLKSIENNINDSNDVIKSETQKTIAVKAITMKQIIFVKDPLISLSNISSNTSINSNDIKSVLLWEFTKSNESSSTTTRRLYLPNSSNEKNEEFQYLSKVSEPIKEEEDTTLELPDDELTTEHDLLPNNGSTLPTITTEFPYHSSCESTTSSISSASSTSSYCSDTSSYHQCIPQQHHQQLSESQHPSQQSFTSRTQSFPSLSYFPQGPTSSQHQSQLQQLQHAHPGITQLRRMQSEPNTSVFYNTSEINPYSQDSEFQSDDFPGFNSNSGLTNSNVFNSFVNGCNANNSGFNSGNNTLNPEFIHLDDNQLAHDIAW